jgi:hypothetical protein
VGINVSEEHKASVFSAELGQVSKVADYMQNKSVTIPSELKRTCAVVYCHGTINYSTTT